MDKSWKDNWDRDREIEQYNFTLHEFANPTPVRKHSRHLENAYLAQAKVKIVDYQELTVIHEQYSQQLECQWFKLYDGLDVWMLCNQYGKWTLSQCGTQVDISIPAADIQWSY